MKKYMRKTIEEKAQLITKNTEEVLKKDEIAVMLDSVDSIKHYIGFEISGKIHLGTGLICMSKVKDLLDAGINCSIFLADWHSWINDKLGGDRELIKNIAAEYFKEGLKASLICLGGDPNKVDFVLGTDLYHNNNDYWATMIEVSKNCTLRRILRSITIMGRKEGQSVDFAKLIYPPMQVADIFFQGIHFPHSGLDQRKAHVIAREVALKLRIKPLLDKSGNKIKPIAIHHHLILGLQKPPVWPVHQENLQDLWASMKMSKSIPNSAIFITEEPDSIRSKLRKAFCPEREIAFNPVLDWAKNLIFVNEKSELLIERLDKFGGDITFNSYQDLKKSFAKGTLHPADLKSAVAESLIKVLSPVRSHFKKPKLEAMKREMETLIVTR